MVTRLWFKLTALLAALVLVGSVVTLFVVTRVTQHHFRDYVADQDMMRAEHLALSFASYYQEQGSFEGAELLVDEPAIDWSDRGHGPQSMMHDEMLDRRGMMRHRGMRPVETERIALIEEDGSIAVNTTGEALPNDIGDRASETGVPVMYGDEPVGRLLVGSMIDSGFDPQQERFLASVRMAVMVSAAAVALVALVFGALFLAGLIRPLRQLTAAAQAIAAGDFTAPVTTDVNDEIGTLADTFRSMRDALAQAEEDRRRMFRDIAHELRTPVTLLRGEIEAMLDGVYPVNTESLRSLHQEIGMLDRLIADVRTVSSMDSPSFRIEPSWVEVGALLERVRDAFRREAAEQGISIVLAVEPDLPRIEADAERLKQVLANLVTNAVRHSATADRVTLAARRSHRQVQGLELTVSDNGQGIAAGEREAIFDRLYRVDPARTRSTGGSGLGLAVARQIVEAHGGSIKADEAEGGGTCITVVLPLSPAETPSSQAR